MYIFRALRRTVCLTAAFALLACGGSASNKEHVDRFVDDGNVEAESVGVGDDVAATPALPYTVDVCERVVMDYGNRAIRTAADVTKSFPERMKNRQNCFIVMSKKDYYLYVYEAQGRDTVLLARYDCCFALKKGNKQRKGDMRTPHCTMQNPFKISQIADASAWCHDFGDGRGSIKSYGDFFMRLVTPGHSGIGIHGSTNNRESVPGRASEGCIRLKDEDIKELRKSYAFVGMKVVIKAEEMDDLPFEVRAIKAWEDEGIARKRHFDPRKTLSNERIQQAKAEQGRGKEVRSKDMSGKGKNMTLDELNKKK